MFPGSSVSDYPGCYSGGNTLLHRLPAALKLAAALALSVAATQARMPVLVIATLLLELLLYLMARLGGARIYRDFRIVLIQAPAVVALYLWRDGWSGLATGMLLAARIGATMLPLLWLQRTTRVNDLIHGFSRWLPRKLSFVIFATLRFLPLVLRDAREIHALQVLRGARVGPRQLLNPLNWNEFAQSVAIPLLIRTVKVSGEVAAAARVRGIADCEERAWLHYLPQSRTPIRVAERE